jgi:Transposase zinc-ribbon domain
MGTLFHSGDTGMNAPTPVVTDVNQHAALPFPQSLPEFQRLLPDDMACVAYLEKLRWQNGFVCPHCRVTGVPSTSRPAPACWHAVNADVRPG